MYIYVTEYVHIAIQTRARAHTHTHTHKHLKPQEPNLPNPSPKITYPIPETLTTNLSEDQKPESLKPQSLTRTTEQNTRFV